MANDVTDAMVAAFFSAAYGDGEISGLVPNAVEVIRRGIEAALAARPEPEGMETMVEDIAILNRVAEVGILGTDPARVGRFVRDFERLSAEVASLKAQLAEVEAEKAAAVAAEREQCALIALRVRDTGGGIAAEKVARAIRARGGEHG